MYEGAWVRDGKARTWSALLRINDAHSRHRVPPPAPRRASPLSRRLPLKGGVMFLEQRYLPIIPSQGGVRGWSCFAMSADFSLRGVMGVGRVSRGPTCV